MMKISIRRHVVAFVILITASCSTETDYQRKSILSQKTIIQLFIEIYMAEAKIVSMNVPSDSSFVLFDVFRQSYIQHGCVPDSTLKKSYSYYLSRPDEFKIIIDAVMDTLMLWKNSAHDRKLKKKDLVQVP